MKRGLFIVLFGLLAGLCVQGDMQAMGRRERQRYGHRQRACDSLKCQILRMDREEVRRHINNMEVNEVVAVLNALSVRDVADILREVTMDDIRYVLQDVDDDEIAAVMRRAFG